MKTAICNLMCALCLGMLSGCGTQQFWHEQTVDPNWKLRRVEFFHTNATRAWCGDAFSIAASPHIPTLLGYSDGGGEAALACADRNYMTGSCTIYWSDRVIAEEPHWIWHELTHCAGKDHPNFSFTNDIPPPDDSDQNRDL